MSGVHINYFLCAQIQRYLFNTGKPCFFAILLVSLAREPVSRYRSDEHERLFNLKVLIYSYDITAIIPTYNAYTVPGSRVSEASTIFRYISNYTFGMRAGVADTG